MFLFMFLFVYLFTVIILVVAIGFITSFSLELQFITEVPRRRILKKGQPLGRLALYRDFSIVQVDSTSSAKSNREWRKVSGMPLVFILLVKY
jgi:hypothetical protein